MKIGVKTAPNAFDAMQTKDMKNERRVLWSEIGIASLLALLVAGYLFVA
jgi:hypothetical protein